MDRIFHQSEERIPRVLPCLSCKAIQLSIPDSSHNNIKHRRGASQEDTREELLQDQQPDAAVSKTTGELINSKICYQRPPRRPSQPQGGFKIMHNHQNVTTRTLWILFALLVVTTRRCVAATTRESVNSASLQVAAAAPMAEALKENPDLLRYWDPVRRYLTKFGYMTTSSSMAADNLRTEEQLRESIKSMQRFGGVRPTGRIDESTLELLRKRRCGMPDLIGNSERVRRYAIQGQKWQKKELTWSIKYWPPSMSSDAVRSELSKAFKIWSDVSQLTFQEIRSPDADIVVSFERGTHGDGYAFDGKGIVLAHAFFPGDGIGGDAHFDAEEPWVRGQPPMGVDGVSLFAVAAHEFGHSLGLSHSSVAGSLMNPFYQTINDNFQLPHDDTVGIQILYGAKNPTQWVPLSPYIPRTTSLTPTRRPVYTGTVGPRRPAMPPEPTTQSPRITEEPHPKKPRTCSTTFDAIAVIRRERFIFKGKYFWRLNNQGLMKDYPAEIKRFFYDKELETIDAVYERPVDTKIVFFSGQKYWLFNGNVKEPGYPRPLTDLGLPPDLKKIDAAMVWGFNGKTYLFSKDKYWRYDENEGRVELDYPRDMDVWKGVPYNLDAAFQNIDGHTYFFKGRRFWQFNDKLMKVKNKKFLTINEHWFGCPSHTKEVPDLEGENRSSTPSLTSKGVQCAVTNIFLHVSFVVMFLIVRMKLMLCL